MNRPKDKRQFSTLMQDANSAFLPAQQARKEPVRVGFILLEHFSMMAFTASIDVLVTSNLVRTAPLFHFSTFSLESTTVTSDLGIDISTDGLLSQLPITGAEAVEIIIICGGFRCSLAEQQPLSSTLKAAARNNITLGGLWNGAITIAYAGLLDNMNCAVHPDNHAFMQEHFNKVTVSENVMVVDKKRVSCAGPSSALEMMLRLVEQVQSKEIVRAVREILSCDQLAEINRQVSSPEETKLIRATDNPAFPDVLHSLLELIRSNIEEPLSVEELASCVGISRRQVERLFQTHLDTTPSRYYLELRITHARRLLLQSNDSIANIALASGFLSSTHFSHCFKDYFGVSPSQARQKFNTRACP